MKSKNPTAFAVALASLTLAMPARADVIYSNLLNTAIPLNFEGVTINVNGGTLNPFFGGVAVANNIALQPLRTNTGGLDTLRNLTFGSTIDASSLYLSSGDGGSQDHLGNTFTAGQEGYIGYKLNGADYGWMRVIFTNNTGGAMVKDWAYDNSGAAINVGGIRQVGQDAILSSSFTLASSLADSGGATNLLKNSAGTNTLTATNTYTGATTISSGTLAIGTGGSINASSGVTINGGTFRYNASTDLTRTVTFTSGTVGGTNLAGTLGGLDIDAGRTLSPGSSNTGTGTAATTSQTWSGGGTYQFEISNATGSAGNSTGWDLLAGSGSLSISANSGSKFNIDIEALGINLGAVNFNEMSSYQWLIADFSSVSGFTADAFAIDTSGFFDVTPGAFAVALGDSPSISGGDNTQIYLTYTAAPIPEPRAMVLAALGALALLRRARRREHGAPEWPFKDGHSTK